MRVSVIGGGQAEDGDETYDLARAVGRLCGERGHEVVCGGLGGVMEAACRGAHEADGGEARSTSGDSSGACPRARTIGVLPGEDRRAANEYVDAAIATGLGNARNVLVVLNGDATIAVDGATGTLSEIGHALDFGRPVAGLGAPAVDLPGFAAVETPAAAVEYVEEAV